MDQRAAKREATSRTASLLREVARRYLDFGGDRYRDIRPVDRRRFARAYNDLADELERRLGTLPPRSDPAPANPDQLLLFKETP